MVVSIRDGSRLSRASDLAPGRPSLTSASTRAIEIATSAVSEPEKTPDRISRTNRVTASPNA